MLLACRTAPYIAARTHPLPQRPGLLHVVEAILGKNVQDVFHVKF